MGYIVGNCDLAEQMIFEKLKERNPHLFPTVPDPATPTVPQPGVFARDWSCPGCGFNVFASREICYKCGTARPSGGGTAAFQTPAHAYLTTPPPPPNTRASEMRSYWMCRKCANMNHNSRPACNMCKTYKPGCEPVRDNQLLLRPAPWD